MKTHRRIPHLSSLLALTATLSLGGLAVGLTSGCVETRTSDSTGQYIDDSVITAKVKSALLGDNNVKSFAVSVETAKGVVQLSGFVNTEDQKEAAGKDARGVAGVQEVKNNLIVK